MNPLLAVLAYIVVVLALALAFCRNFRRQNERRDPFIVCRKCVRRDECRVPAGLDACSTVEVEDEVRAVLDSIPQFKDI